MMVRPVMVNELSIVILKGLLTTTFLVRVCAANKPLNFINWLFLRCTVPFSIKEVCVLSLIPSFHHQSLYCCWRGVYDCCKICYIIFVADLLTSSRLGFMAVLGTPLNFCICFFSLLPASLIISRAIHASFSESAQFCFRLALRHFHVRDFCLMITAIYMRYMI